MPKLQEQISDFSMMSISNDSFFKHAMETLEQDQKNMQRASFGGGADTADNSKSSGSSYSSAALAA